MKKASSFSAAVLLCLTEGIDPDHCKWHVCKDRHRPISPAAMMMRLRETPIGTIYQFAIVHEEPSGEFVCDPDVEVLKLADDEWIAISTSTRYGRMVGGVVGPTGTLSVHAIPQSTCSIALDEACRVMWTALDLGDNHQWRAARDRLAAARKSEPPKSQRTTGRPQHQLSGVGAPPTPTLLARIGLVSRLLKKESV